MKRRILCIFLLLCMVCSLLPAAAVHTLAAEALPTSLTLLPSEANGLPAAISLIHTTNYDLYLPGNVDPDACFFSWDGELPGSDGTAAYASGAMPIPAPGQTKTYTFTLNGKTASFTVTCWQGSQAVAPIFIEIDESLGTIAAMNNDPQHNTECSGVIYIDGQEHVLSKMKGRGNYAWSQSKDKRAYNINLGAKCNLLGIDSGKTKKWSLLANVCDHSLLRDKIGYDLGYQMGIGLDSANADIWMNGVYQGTYLVTPKTDSFTSDDGYLLENDNNTEPAISAGGDPSFTLRGLYGSSGSDVTNNGDNRITVKDIGDNLLRNEAGEVDESEANLNRITAVIKAHLQDAWDAIRSDSGYNDKGVYYADYVDLTTFAKMYLVLEYCKDYDVCAGSNFFQRYATGDTDKYYAGPVWDLDSSLGCTQENGGLRLSSDISMTTGYGFFIRNIYDYRTSIYKNLGKHPDFMEEVLEVYEQYKEVFDAIPDKVNAFSAEMAASAMMNFNKVDPVDNYNIARYNRDTVKNAGTRYEQVYHATTNSKTDWPVYVENLHTFCAARSMFFGEFMVPEYSNPVIGEAGEDLAPGATQVYSDYTASWENLNGINNPDFEPTSSNMGIGLGWGNWSQTTGSVHYVGYTWSAPITTNAIDLYWYDDNGGTRVPSDFHLEYRDENGAFQPISFDTPVSDAKVLNQYNRLTFPTVTTSDLRLVMTTASNASGIYRFKVYNAVELEGIPVVFHTTSRATVTTFDTQDLTQSGHEDADYAFARSSATGEIDNSGSGQVNFVVHPAEGYRVAEILAEPAENYANLKGPADTGTENGYRITKVTGRVDVTVRVEKIPADEPVDPPIPLCEHVFDEDGICVKCGEEAFRVEFICGEGASVTTFRTQDLAGQGTEAAFAFPRSSATGDIDVSGEGQVNFLIQTTGGFKVTSVTAAPATGFKNLKGPADTGVENAYRLTKVNGPVTVTIETLQDQPIDPPDPFRFDDVQDEGRYYFEPVYWAYNHDPQITNGTSATLFSPARICTRGQVVTFLYRAAGEPEVGDAENRFTDVKEGAYYYNAVLWAVENEITTGTSSTTFSPNADCTRAQIVTFLWRFAGKPSVEGIENPFTDVPEGRSYSEAVLWAYDLGITKGKTATTFVPGGTCSRGEVVTFLYRFMNSSEAP